jgi:hypothetical protein
MKENNIEEDEKVHSVHFSFPSDYDYIREDEVTEKIIEKERRLVTQPYDIAVRSLIGQVDNGDLLLKDYYQRHYVWDNVKASKLIESLMLNIPIPVCYFSEGADGIYTVIDGHQRIKSIHRYVNNKFSLRKLKQKSELNGKMFNKLDTKHQRNILSRTIRCIVITRESDSEIRFDVFERLNTGAVMLKPQEIRNCIFRGNLNDLLNKLVSNETWLKCRGKDKQDLRMYDQELILRYFALKEKYSEYKPYMKNFLNKFMKEYQNITELESEDWEKHFYNTIILLYSIFKKNSYRIYNLKEQKWETRTHTALFDVLMITFDKLNEEDIIEKEDVILKAYLDVQSEEDFIDCIDKATGDRSRLLGRLKIWNEKLLKIGIDTKLKIPKA